LRFLLDTALSPLLAKRLAAACHDVAHVRDYGMQRPSDVEIFERAREEDRVLVSADTDFGTLLALRRERHHRSCSSAAERSGARSSRPRCLLANLPKIEHDLAQGSVVVFEPDRIRIRSLPVGE